MNRIILLMWFQHEHFCIRNASGFHQLPLETLIWSLFHRTGFSGTPLLFHWFVCSILKTSWMSSQLCSVFRGRWRLCYIYTTHKRVSDKLEGSNLWCLGENMLEAEEQRQSFKKRKKKLFKAQEMWLLRKASLPHCPQASAAYNTTPVAQTVPCYCSKTSHKTFFNEYFYMN